MLILYKNESYKVICELSGNAGTGKTSVINGLAKSPPWKIYTPLPKKTVSLYALFMSLFVCFFCIKPVHWRKMIPLIYRKLSLYKSLSNEVSGFFVIEEGPWHLIYGNIFGRLHSNSFTKYIFWGYLYKILLPGLSDVVVHLSADDRLVYKRRKIRNRHKDKFVTYGEIVKARISIEDNIDFISIKNKGTKLVRLDVDKNSVDIDKILTNLSKFG